MMELRHARFHPLCPTSGLCDGLVNQELLLQNEYLVAENRILRAHVHGEFIVQAAMGSDTTLRILPFAMRQASAMGMLDTARAHYPELVAYILCFGAPLGLAIGASSTLHSRLRAEK